MDGSQGRSDIDKIRQQADELEGEAMSLRAKAQAMDGLENMVMLLAHVVNQVQELTQIMEAPKVVERDNSGRPVGIRIGGFDA